ncbi:hypothetical protein CN555_02260 [Bacillus wiedmannii]|nr:hypothetical protein CN555_02260 [Bacillus wiedmannii]
MAVLLNGIPFGALGPPFSVISNAKYPFKSRTSLLGIPVSVIFCDIVFYPSLVILFINYSICLVLIS